MKETVAQYLARGGVIQHIPTGQSGEQIRFTRRGTGSQSVRYVSGNTKTFNRGKQK